MVTSSLGKHHSQSQVIMCFSVSSHVPPADKNLGPSKGPNRHLPEIIQMAKTHRKGASDLLGVREMHIKFTGSHPEHSLEWLRKEEKEELDTCEIKSVF